MSTNMSIYDIIEKRIKTNTASKTTTLVSQNKAAISSKPALPYDLTPPGGRPTSLFGNTTMRLRTIGTPERKTATTPRKMTTPTGNGLFGKMAPVTTSPNAPIASQKTNAHVNAKKTTTNPVGEKKTKTNFLCLPGELRNQIYALALLEEQSIELTQNRLLNLSITGGPTLLKAHKQITAEGKSVFWLDNRFYFVDDTLDNYWIDKFEAGIGHHTLLKLKQIGVRRHFTVGHGTKPIEIRFSVEIRNGRLRIVRPIDEKRPFPGAPGIAKFSSPYTEPCRCEVRAMIQRISAPRRDHQNGYDVLMFLSKYAEMTRTLATSVDFTICQVCKSARRR